MKHLQKLTGPLFILMLAFVLAACGSSLQKPTGLEDQPKPAQTEELPEQAAPEEPDVTEEPNQEKDEDTSSEQKEVVQNDEKAEQKTAPAVKPEQPVKQPTAEKPVAKPSEKPADKQPKTESPVKKPEAKPVKPVEKPVAEKPSPKPSEKPAAPVDKPAAPAKSKIVYSIVISSTEVPLPPTEMEITDGDTVLAALIDITRKHKIQMDYRGGQGATAYVEGIENVYEFDRGQGSGWMYRVNGIFPDRGAGVVPLMDGDRVEWLYTTNLGVDLGADLKPFRR